MGMECCKKVLLLINDDNDIRMFACKGKNTNTLGNCEMYTIEMWKNTCMLIKDRFYGNVLKMFTGTAGAYIFWALAMLVIGRLYSPEYFGRGQIFISATSILATLATGRYEIAFTLPHFRFQAIQLFLFSILLSLSCVVGVSFLLFGFRDMITHITGVSTGILFLVPIYMMELCLYVLLYAWLVRTKRYRETAIGLVLFPLSYVFFCIVLYPVEISMHKLIFSIILARGLEILYYGYYLYKDMKYSTDKITWHSVFRRGKEYADFPKYVFTGSFVESMVIYAGPFLVTTFWGVGATGCYSMAMQILAAPAGLIAKAVGDVFRQEGSRLYGKHRECNEFYRKNLRLCAIYSIVVCIGAYVVVPRLLPLFLGTQWTVVGQYVRWMLLMEFATLVSTPLGNMYIIARRQKEYMTIQLVAFLTSVLGIVGAGELGYGLETALMTWGVLTMIVSSVSIYGGWNIAKGGSNGL